MKKILIIEDNLDVRENTAEILTLAQYNVITAKDGKEGVELAQKETPDLIICDIMMKIYTIKYIFLINFHFLSHNKIGAELANKTAEFIAELRQKEIRLSELDLKLE